MVGGDKSDVNESGGSAATSHFALRTSHSSPSKPKLGYKNLKVWLAAKELVKTVYAKLRTFPPEEKYALCDQLRRAVVSIPSNIAEGYGRDTHKDFAHFISMATGSLYEVETQLDIAADLNYMERDPALDEQIISLVQMLAAFRTRLLTSPTPNPHSSRLKCEVQSAECEGEGEASHLAPRTSHSSSHLAPRTSH